MKVGVAGLGTQSMINHLEKAQSQMKKRKANKNRKPSEGEADEENTLDRARAVKMVSKFFQKEVAEQKQKVLGYNPEGRIEIYTDKNRAAAVALGDEDIKTSIKVKRKREKKLEQPEDTNSTVHITEAVRAISQGRITTALSCAEKAVEGSKDPEALVVRGRCHLLLGNLQKALEDSRTALKADSKLVKAVLVKAEALYGMGEFERSLVLFHRGARKRPDLTAFSRGVHKAREAIINAIGGDKFPDMEDPMISTSSFHVDTVGSKPSQVTVPEITLSDAKGSKKASKRLLGGLSSDKHFLESLVNRKSLARELESTDNGIGKSGTKIAAVAKEALASLQHLESFMWQRDPGGIANKSGGEKTTLQKRKEKEARAKLRADLKRRVAELLEKLKTGEDLQETVLDGECLVNDVKEAEISEKILCRLLVGLGIALPKCGRPEDAIAILTDAVHIARANEYSDEEHSGVEQLGKILAEQGRHAEAVAVWERRISSASNSAQRASLFLLIAKSYFAMRKVETGKFYGTKSVKEADVNEDNSTALAALLALASADVQQGNKDAALKNLERCEPLLTNAPGNLVEEYESYKHRIADIKESPS